MAYPLGGPQADFKFFFIEMHYNNPSLVQGTHIINIFYCFIIIKLVFRIKRKGLQDYSGVRLYVTENYRPIEFGVLTVCAYKHIFKRN